MNIKELKRVVYCYEKDRALCDKHHEQLKGTALMLYNRMTETVKRGFGMERMFVGTIMEHCTMIEDTEALRIYIGRLTTDKKRFLADFYFKHDNKVRWPTKAVTLKAFNKKKNAVKDVGIELTYLAYQFHWDQMKSKNVI